MFSVREQQILHQIEDGLRADDRGFSRRFTLRLAVLRCRSPLRRRGMLAVTGAAQLVFAVLVAAAVPVRTLVAAARIALQSAAAALEAIVKRAWLRRAGGPEPRAHPAGRT